MDFFTHRDRRQDAKWCNSSNCRHWTHRLQYLSPLSTKTELQFEWLLGTVPKQYKNKRVVKCYSNCGIRKLLRYVCYCSTFCVLICSFAWTSVRKNFFLILQYLVVNIRRIPRYFSTSNNSVECLSKGFFTLGAIGSSVWHKS